MHGLLAFLAPRTLFVAASGVVHASLVATFISMSHGRAAMPVDRVVSTREEQVLPVELFVEPAVELRVEASPRHTAEPATHHHSHPMPPSHDATPHDPSLVHAAARAPAGPAAAPTHAGPVAPEAPTPSPAAAPEAVFTIVLPAATLTTAAGVGGTTSRGGGGSDQAGPGPGMTYGESSVSQRATLLGSAVARYPPRARAEEVEADVPLEIVVDVDGRVVGARVLTPAGFGFDDAALAAIRGYRFSAAQRDGRAVRVRMRWSVQFRLR